MCTDNRISASVGQNGKNVQSDVMVVQRLLMACVGTYGPLRPFTPDGVCGSATIDAITNFQRNVLRMQIPDGRVDPNGKTLAALIARAKGAPVRQAISASVGQNGKNVQSDVMVVQRLLMACVGTYGPLRPFTPDGVCESLTIDAITNFQRNVLRMQIPDGRVDPNGKTLVALIARAKGAPVGPGSAPGALPGGQANTLSQAGLNFIADREGLVTKLYNDAAGLATIGYGHLVHRGHVGTNPAAEASYINGITAAEALQLLQRDAALHVAAVNRAVRTPLTQNQFDALVCFSFNVGGAGMGTSTLVRIINQGNYTPDQIRVAFGMWVKADGKVHKGLVLRRQLEAALFNEGRY